MGMEQVFTVMLVAAPSVYAYVSVLWHHRPCAKNEMNSFSRGAGVTCVQVYISCPAWFGWILLLVHEAEASLLNCCLLARYFLCLCNYWCYAGLSVSCIQRS